MKDDSNMFFSHTNWRKS